MTNQPEVQAQLHEVVTLIKAGDRAAARERLSSLMKTNSQNADVFYLAGRIAGNAEQQTKFLNHALRLNPDHKLAQEQLQKEAAVPAPTKVAFDSETGHDGGKLQKEAVVPPPAVAMGKVAISNRRMLQLRIAAIGGLVLVGVVWAVVRIVSVSPGYLLFTGGGVTTFNEGQFQVFQRNAVKNGQSTVHGFDWSLDGTRILGSDSNDNLCVMNADGTNLQMLGLKGQEPTWSPDNQKIMFQEPNQRGLYVFDVNDKTTIHIGDGPVYFHYFTWSPDSKRVAFTDNNDENLVIAQADGSKVVKWPDGYSPQWSPDGTHLAFSDYHYVINVADTDGGNRRPVGKGDFPTWSPDGMQIAYSDNDSIYVVNADGSNLRTLTKPDKQVEYMYAAWSPDGRFIAYVYYKNDDPRLDVMSANGSVTYTGQYRISMTNMLLHRVWMPANMGAIVSAYTHVPNK